MPAKVKQPTDHLSPKSARDDEPKNLKVEVRGTKIEVPADALNDFELLDDLNEIDQNRNATRIASVLRRLVGDQWKTVMDLARNEKTGRVTIEEGANLVQEIMEALNPNSSSSQR